MKKKERIHQGVSYKGDKAFQTCLSIFFILLSAVVLAPVLHVIAISFSSKNSIILGDVGLFPKEFTLEAYGRIFENESFMNSFLYSLALTIGYTALAMFMTILAAYPLSRSHLKGRSVIMALIVLTMYFDPGTIPNYLNIRNLGLLDTVWALILPCVLSAYNLIILRTFFSSIDNSLYEAAKLDGCSELQTLIRVVLPLTKPALATLTLFYAVSRWNNVSDVIYYVNDSKLYTVQLQLKQMMDMLAVSAIERAPGTAQTLVADNIKAASIVFSMVPMLVLYPFVQKYFTKGIMLGAVKG